MRAPLALLMLAGCFEEPRPSPCDSSRVLLRNPVTLHCDTRYAPSETCHAGPLPTWPACYQDPCVGITSEATCLATAGCRGVYDDCIVHAEPCYLGTPFIACLQLDHGGPADGACDGLDAQACSTRDDCAGWYVRSGCEPEGTAAPRIDDDPCLLAFAFCAAETPITGS